MLTKLCPPPRQAHRGLSIVELLVGIAVGLFVLAGATMVASNQVADNKRLLLETQLQQDMRTAMDVIVRDIRRSGYWYFADDLPMVGASLGPPSPYQAAGQMDPSNVLLYTYSSAWTTANASLPAVAADFKGFRRNGDVIQVQLGNGNWQALTDPDSVRITSFTAITEGALQINLPTCAAPPCPAANPCGTPRMVTRRILLAMEGEARHDPSVRRRLGATVRVRNEEVCL